jgi:Holliday junction DNA helicase RuvA
MIAYLRGQLLCVEENHVILEVQGIGYEVTVPPRLLSRLPETGKELELYTHLNVREDALQLYGFTSQRQRALFRLLLKAQGVGPKVALTIIDTFQEEQLAVMIAQGDLEGLQRIPGVGKKSAQRLLLDLKGKLPSNFEPVLLTSTGVALSELEEVTEGLAALGYSRHEVETILKKVDRETLSGKSANEILRLVLKELGRRKR